MKASVSCLPLALVIMSGCSTQSGNNPQPIQPVQNVQTAQPNAAVSVPAHPAEAAPKNPKPREYNLGVTAQLQAGRTLSIDITSDVPPGSSLDVLVSRDYYQKGKADAYSGQFLEKKLQLQDRKVHVDVPINDAVWYNEHEAKVKRFPEYIFPPVRISPNVEIEVRFEPLDQPSDVKSEVGARGDNLRGKFLKRRDLYHWLSVTKMVAVPFERGLGTNEMSVNALMFGKDWPFTVTAGVLGCDGDREVVTFRNGGKTYALNGTAVGKRRYLPVEAIWTRDRDIPGARKNIGPMIEKGLTLCR
jgi:hypothetical protein